MHVLIITCIYYLSSMLFMPIFLYLQLHDEFGMSKLMWLQASFPYLVLTIYWSIFLWRQWHLLTGIWRKMGYTLFTVIMLVAVGQLIFPTLLALIILTIAIQIGLWLLWIILTVLNTMSGKSSSKKWDLDNGDTVRESTGLFGEKYYRGASGTNYTTNDGGKTFTEK